MLHRLCDPPSIPLSFNLAAVVPRRSGCALAKISSYIWLKYTSRISNKVRNEKKYFTLIGQGVDYQGI
jgi:hypothetical protein